MPCLEYGLNMVLKTKVLVVLSNKYCNISVRPTSEADVSVIVKAAKEANMPISLVLFQVISQKFTSRPNIPHLAEDHLCQLNGVHPPHVDVHRVLLDVRAGVAVPATAHQNVQ